LETSLIRAKQDMSHGIVEGDLFLPVSRFNVRGGYEYAMLERISDGRKFKVPLSVLQAGFDDSEDDVYQNYADAYVEALRAAIHGE